MNEAPSTDLVAVPALPQALLADSPAAAVGRPAVFIKERLPFIDCCRGILVLLMGSAHALSVSSLGADQPLRSSSWLPSGSYEGFIMLSGFTVAAVFSWDKKEETQRRLLRRAWQVFVVMFVSNVFFLLAKYFTAGELATVKHVAWWIGLVTLRTEYSISGILLPTVALLLFAPILFRAAERFSHVYLLVAAVVFALIVRAMQWFFVGHLSTSYVSDVLLNHGVSGFPLLPFFSSGVLGFFIGLVWKRSSTRFTTLSATAIALTLFGLKIASAAELPRGIMPLVHESIVVSRFLLILVIAIALTKVIFVRRGSQVFTLVGRYTLFSFLIHRPIIQTWAFLGKHYIQLGAEMIYIVCLLGTFALIVVLCAARQRFASLDRFLKTVYL